jgi:hypothetical protein
MIDVLPHVMPVAVTVVFALSFDAWQCSDAAPSGAGVVLDELIITMRIVLQKTAPCVTLLGTKSVLLQSSKQSYVKVRSLSDVKLIPKYYLGFSNICHQLVHFLN